MLSNAVNCKQADQFDKLLQPYFTIIFINANLQCKIVFVYV